MQLHPQYAPGAGQWPVLAFMLYMLTPMQCSARLVNAAMNLALKQHNAHVNMILVFTSVHQYSQANTSVHGGSASHAS